MRLRQLGSGPSSTERSRPISAARGKGRSRRSASAPRCWPTALDPNWRKAARFVSHPRGGADQALLSLICSLLSRADRLPYRGCERGVGRRSGARPALLVMNREAAFNVWWWNTCSAGRRVARRRGLAYSRAIDGPAVGQRRGQRALRVEVPQRRRPVTITVRTTAVGRPRRRQLKRRHYVPFAEQNPTTTITSK
jgi:hypothetical protein